MPRKIEKITRKDGSTGYRARGVSAGKHPSGKRRQVTITRDRRKDVEAEIARIGYQLPRGEFVPRWNGTLNELLDAWERAALRGKEAATAVSYRAALRIPRERLGSRRAQSITRDDVEALVDFALERGRVRGGKPGTGLGVRSARLMVGRLSAAFEQGIDDQKVYRNPCRKVRVDGRPQPPRITWSAEQLRRFLAAADADRFASLWRLMSYGLRRSEGAGLLWSNVRLAERTVIIGPVRVIVNGRAFSKPNPKSENGWRTLPLDDVVAAQLEALQARQMEEMLTAEPAYEGGDHVASDELGRPVSPEWLSDEFQRLAAAAGLPRIRLHDLRHTSSSLMATADVPANVRALWHGHTQAVAVGTYTHARPEDLALAAAALGRIHNPDVTKV